MALQPWRTGKIIRITDETSDTKRFWIEVPELETVDFIPGQFVTLDLPIHEKANKRWRSYSIASWPDGSNVFELIIVLDHEGTGTPFLFSLKVGSELSLRGPQGVFHLKEPVANDLFLICTGTGIAPFRSMVHHMKNAGISHRDIYLIFGCRHQADLLYFDELKQLEKDMPGFHYIPTLSKEKWEGHTGYVHAVYESLCSNRQAADFYLCGWKGMIDEAKASILGMGYDKKSIHQEVYG